MQNPAQAFFHRYRRVPPAAFHYLSEDLERVLEIVGLGRSWRERLVAAGRLQAGERAVDVGCGGGELAVLVKRLHPDAEVAGVDPDPRALELARMKAAAWGVEIATCEAQPEALPFEDASRDAVFSALRLHQLPTEAKRAALREARRVLGPGGRLVIADFSAPTVGPLRWAAWPLRWDVVSHSGDNFRGLIPALLAEAGFGAVEEVERVRQVVVTWRAQASKF